MSLDESEGLGAGEGAVGTVAVGLDDLVAVLDTAHVAHMDESGIEDDLIVVNLVAHDDEAESLDETLATT